MSLEDMRREIKQAFYFIRNNVHDWEVRDTLCQLVNELDFYGDRLDVIDKHTAMDICYQFQEYFPTISYDEDRVQLIYDLVSYYATL